MRQDPYPRFRLIIDFIAKHVDGTLIYQGQQSRVTAIGQLSHGHKHTNDNSTWYDYGWNL